MGTVYARSRKLWIGFQGPDGRWVYRSSGYRVGQELLAQKLLAEIEESVRARGVTGKSYTFAEYAARWAKARVLKGRHTNAKLDAKALENHVYGAELEIAGRRVVFGRLDLAEVRLAHVRALLEQLELKNTGTEAEPDHLAPRTRRSLYSLVKRVFDAAAREDLITKNPCQLERAEQPQLLDKDITFRGGAVFTAAELERLISDERLPLDRRVFYAFAFLGGLREGEIAALRWSAVDMEPEPLAGVAVHASYTRKNKREKSPKNKLPRQVPVHPALAALLAQWRLSGWAELFGRTPRAEDLVVPNRAGRYVTDLNVTENFAHDLEVLGMRHRRFHDARRTFVTLARASGAGSLLRWVSHGPSKTEMQDVYSTPPWEALCREVLCIKAQLRAGASVRQLAAGNRGRSVAAEAADGRRSATTKSTTGGRMQDKSAATSTVSEVPRARFEASRGGTVERRLEGIKAGYEDQIDADDRQKAADRSTATTVVSLRRPFRGGMRIEDDPDPHPASSTAGVRR